MLKPAQMYEEQLNIKNINSWYNPENIFFDCWTGQSVIDLPEDNYNSHHFVSVDSKNKVIGYITYTVDWVSSSASGFGIISFDKGNVLFAKDVYTAICDIFDKYHFNRIEWYCYADNPVIKSYRRFIQKHGGQECGYLRQSKKLQDGKFHDSVIFEILNDEFRR